MPGPTPTSGSWSSYAASIAQRLHSVGIPCVLWGHCLLNLWGVPSILGSIDFILPDRSLTMGADHLSQFPFLRPCPDPSTCSCTSPRRFTPPPAFHAHLFEDTEDSGVTVGIYPQSRTLWFLPPLEKTISVHRDDWKLSEHFIRASDQTALPPERPGRGSGVYSSPEGHMVVAPKSHILLEAYLRIYARDVGTRIGGFGMAMIAYMEEYVDDDGYLDAKKLPTPLKEYYAKLRGGEMKVRPWAMGLRNALGLPEIDFDGD